MKIAQISNRKFDISDSERVVNIWKECGLVRDWNNTELDIQRKLSFQEELFLLESLKIKLLRQLCLDMMGIEVG